MREARTLATSARLRQSVEGSAGGEQTRREYAQHPEGMRRLLSSPLLRSNKHRTFMGCFRAVSSLRQRSEREKLKRKVHVKRRLAHDAGCIRVGRPSDTRQTFVPPGHTHSSLPRSLPDIWHRAARIICAVVIHCPTILDWSRRACPARLLRSLSLSGDPGVAGIQLALAAELHDVPHTGVMGASVPAGQ